MEVSAAAIARAVAPDAVLPLTLLDASDNQTFTFDLGSVTGGAWRLSSVQRAGWADAGAEENTSAPNAPAVTVEAGPIDPDLLDILAAPPGDGAPADPLQRLMESLLPAGERTGCLPTLDFLSDQWTDAVITCEHGKFAGSGLKWGAFLAAALRAAGSWRRAHAAITENTAIPADVGYSPFQADPPAQGD